MKTYIVLAATLVCGLVGIVVMSVMVSSPCLTGKYRVVIHMEEGGAVAIQPSTVHVKILEGRRFIIVSEVGEWVKKATYKCDGNDMVVNLVDSQTVLLFKYDPKAERLYKEGSWSADMLEDLYYLERDWE